MKILPLLFFLMTSIASLSAQSVGDLDKKNGFRDILLEAPKQTLKIAMEAPRESNNTQQVKLERSDLKFNGMPLQGIACELFDNKIVQIRIYGATEAKKGEVISQYMDFLKTAFGKPTKSADDPATHSSASEWLGTKVRLSVFEKTGEEKNGTVQYQIQIKFTSIPLESEMQRYAEKLKNEGL